MEVLDWMRPPAPEQGGLARDEFRAGCALGAAPIPGIVLMVQKNTNTRVEWVGTSVFLPVPITLSSQCS